MWERKYIIWSNENLDTEDWKESFKEYIEMNNLDIDPNDEEELYKYMVETNDEYLSDERINLNINVPDTDTVLVIADLEFWDGRCSAYREIHADKISDCLYTDRDTDYATWYLDKQGDLRCDAADCHNGSKKHQLCRAYKAGVTEAQKEELKDRLLSGTASQADIDNISECLGDRIAKAFEWDKVWRKETLLPPYCFSQLPSTGEIIRITRYEDGYRLANIDCGSREANAAYIKELNKSIRVTEAQEKAMSVGSMFGWNVPGANPSVYLKSAASPQREDSVKSVSAFCEKYKKQESNADRERE